MSDTCRECSLCVRSAHIEDIAHSVRFCRACFRALVEVIEHGPAMYDVISRFNASKGNRKAFGELIGFVEPVEGADPGRTLH